MEMLERYLYEVGKYLLEKDRNIIQNKIKSTVLEMVEQKKSEGVEVETALRLTLIELGSPQEIAQKYDSRLGYLVGPKLFGIYKIVLGFSILGVSLGLVTALIVQLSFDSDINVGVSLLELFEQIVTGALSIIGSVTLVFYIIQRFSDADQLTTKEKWDPDKLPEIPKKVEKISKVGEVVAIVVTIVIMFIFNFHPDIIGTFYKGDGGSYVFESMFSLDQIKTYLIFLNPLWVMIIFVHLYVLSRGKRTVRPKIFGSLGAIGIFTTLWIMLGDIGEKTTVGNWAEPLSGSLRMGLAVVLIILVVDIGRYFVIYKK